MRVIFEELKSFKKEIIIIIFSVLVTAFCSAMLPYLTRGIIDYAIPQNNYKYLYAIVGHMLVLVIVYVVFGILTAKCASYISMGVGHNLRKKVFDKVVDFSQEEIDKFGVSSLITRTNSDIMQVQTFLVECLNIAILSPILCITGLIMALLTSKDLSLIMIIFIPLLLIFIIIIGKKSMPLSTTIQKKLDTINLIIREKLTGVRVIRAFGTNDFEERKFDKENLEYTKINKKLLDLTNLFRPTISVVLALTVTGVLIFAFYIKLKYKNNISVGQVMAVIEYIIQIMLSITMLTVVFLMLPRAKACASRTDEILKSISKIKNPIVSKKSLDKKGYITFDHVTFTYEGSTKPAINDLSFEAKPGEVTAIIGGTGMGKSSIVNLIPRLYDVTSGHIYIDDIDIKDYNLRELRSKIGFVPQKAMLFKGTIDTNLCFGGDNPSDYTIEKAVKIAQSYEFILNKDKGFDSSVSQGGNNFSGGQKQRLCIARALVREPEIYVFDDSFSALDFKTDKILRSELKKVTSEATVIIVAQRVSTIMDADRIIVVENGDVVGIGTHNELISSCNVYKEIVNSQLSSGGEN